MPGRLWAVLSEPRERGGQQEDKRALIQSVGCRARPSPEIHALRQGWAPAGVVAEAGEETTDAPDGRAQRQWPDEGDLGGPGETERAFNSSDSCPAAQQAADDGLAAEQGVGLTRGAPQRSRGDPAQARHWSQPTPLKMLPTRIQRLASSGIPGWVVRRAARNTPAPGKIAQTFKDEMRMEAGSKHPRNSGGKSSGRIPLQRSVEAWQDRVCGRNGRPRKRIYRGNAEERKYRESEAPFSALSALSRFPR